MTSPSSTHPISSLLPAVLSSTARTHPASYHHFIESPYSKDLSSSLLADAVPVRAIHEHLLTWFDTVRDKRRMPWRKDVLISSLSPKELNQRAYEVWISEIMLQQTQVSTVIPYFNKWIEAFPSVKDLAEADIEKVNERWKGLGYYSRASRLLSGAKKVVDQFDGVIPSSVEGLLQIDGIGPYSAGAISSIAFGKRSPLVDGNVTRVLSRLTAVHSPSTAKSTTTYVWSLADLLVPPQSSRRPKNYEELKAGGPNKCGSWNQALMELGATICTPKTPKCNECPLKSECAAYAEVRHAKKNSLKPPKASTKDIEDLCSLCSPIEDFSSQAHDVTRYPMAKEKKKVREENTLVCILEWRSTEAGENEILLCKRPEKGLLAGLFEFASIDLPSSTSIDSDASNRKMLNRLLESVIVDPLPFSSTATSSTIRIIETTTFPPAIQVYSHMVRTYLTTRIVIESPMRPRLITKEKISPIKSKSKPTKKKRKLSSTSDESSASDDESEKLVQSIPGRARWFLASEVENANTGGAVDKIWELRQRFIKGLSLTGSGKAKKGASAANMMKKLAETTGGVKQKGLMMNWLGGAIKEKKAESEPKDEERMIVAEKEEELSPSKKEYKKRRIVIASDDEEAE